jgi:hypothetical protein
MIRIFKYITLIASIIIFANIVIFLTPGAKKSDYRPKMAELNQGCDGASSNEQEQQYNVKILNPTFVSMESGSVAPYFLKATDMVKAQDRYILNNITGKYRMQENECYIDASIGFVNKEENQLILKQDVNMRYGIFTLFSQIVHIDLQMQHITITTPVTLNFNQNSIKAGGLKADSKENTITLENGVISKISIGDL